MKRLLMRLVAAALLVGFLAACSAPNTQRSFRASMQPNGSLGYEYDPVANEINVTSRNLVFSTPAGSPAVTINGFDVAYFDNGGNFVTGWVTATNALDIFVPAGFSCSEPDERLGCTTTSLDAIAAPGQPTAVDAVTLQLLHVDAIEAHIAAGAPADWFAEVTFYGQSAYGPVSETFSFFIVVPTT